MQTSVVRPKAHRCPVPAHAIDDQVIALARLGDDDALRHAPMGDRGHELAETLLGLVVPIRDVDRRRIGPDVLDGKPLPTDEALVHERWPLLPCFDVLHATHAT
jgi:hypothetical protein